MNRRPPTKEEIQRIADSVPRGPAIEAAGISVSTFHRYAKHYKVKTLREGSSYVLTPQDDELIYQLRELGISIREIGRKFSVSHTAIIKRLRRRAEGKPCRQALDAD